MSSTSWQAGNQLMVVVQSVGRSAAKGKGLDRGRVHERSPALKTSVGWEEHVKGIMPQRVLEEGVVQQLFHIMPWWERRAPRAATARSLGRGR
jgi:hypothetical protein